ncbi:hypothetical protein T265_10301 [Opisthorchis viverrini]|uniref:Uncharacterized protein n=1 Tax=Opisthorchis viverrini TaxID=6198 RepID=A0A075A1T3_OPIVI|nr:hypothetical protein T265_10301 [Opisthorchis viverrini]KER21369.1 hypothetical protein T265_10301 [Opisthorchis viverrini]
MLLRSSRFDSFRPRAHYQHSIGVLQTVVEPAQIDTVERWQFFEDGGLVLIPSKNMNGTNTEDLMATHLLRGAIRPVALLAPYNRPAHKPLIELKRSNLSTVRQQARQSFIQKNTNSMPPLTPAAVNGLVKK